MQFEGYSFGRDEFARLLIAKHYPERTDGESWVIKAFLEAHLSEFDRITFSKRIGQGVTPDPSLLPAVARNAVFSSKLRIDILAWRGNQPVIVEVKQHITPASLGQVLTYRHHYLAEFADAPDPELVVVGRTASDDAISALNAHGITVYLYPDAKPP